MFAYGPSDLDPTIRTYPDLDLISRVSFGSGGSDRIRPLAAALLAGEPFPAAARFGNSPEFTVNGAPGVDLTRAWVGKDKCGMRDLPRPQAGHG